MPPSFRFFIALMLSILCFTAPARTDVGANTESSARSAAAAAFHECGRLAELGDAEAQHCLGVLYAEGRGVPQDYEQAWRWFEKAAAQGLASAHFYLGVLYGNGHGVPRDYVHPTSYEEAVAHGYARAQFNLGVLYANRQGVPKNYSKARQWYEQMETQGYATAQYNLRLLYDNRLGVP